MGNKSIIPVGTAHNVITSGTYIKGDIKAEEDLRIDGKIEGTVECSGKIIVGSEAEVIGDIYCVNADLMGKIRGNIEVQGTVSLKAQVNFTGEIITKYLVIESGAVFNGVCKMQQ
jgi:cytoskeletal protein CcmA (bactofilin family)